VSSISPAQAAEITLEHYGLVGTTERLASEHDDTFRLAGADGVTRLLKISVASPALAARPALTPPVPVPAGGAAADGTGFQTALLLHLARVAPELPVQRVVATVDGRPEIALTLDRAGEDYEGDGIGGGEPRLVRLTSWLDGQLLGRGTTSVGLRREIGGTLGRLNIALRGFAHPGAGRTHQWDLQNFGALRALLERLPESGMLPSVGQALGADGQATGGVRAALADCLDRFETVVRPALAGVPVQVIHTDFHGENLLTDGGERITGILDFGDALAGPVAMDVGVAACYQLGTDGPGGDLLAPALDVVAGYHAVDPLSGADLDLVAEFMVARVAARIIVSQSTAARDPANSGYLLRRTPQAVLQLAALRALAPDEIGRRLRAACSLGVVR
jgi:hydroxylysine kinase